MKIVFIQKGGDAVKKPRISMIVAMCANNNVIGTADNKLPWHISADLKNFKKITTGHPIVMGRKTWEMFGDRPLPNRPHFVVSNKNLVVPNGVVVTKSIFEAICIARKIDHEEIFIIGGASVYEQTLDLVDRLYITLVEGFFEGVTIFPKNWHLFFNQMVYKKALSDPNHKANFMIFEK